MATRRTYHVTRSYRVREDNACDGTSASPGVRRRVRSEASGRNARRVTTQRIPAREGMAARTNVQARCSLADHRIGGRPTQTTEHLWWRAARYLPARRLDGVPGRGSISHGRTSATTSHQTLVATRSEHVRVGSRGDATTREHPACSVRPSHASIPLARLRPSESQTARGSGRRIQRSRSFAHRTRLGAAPSLVGRDAHGTNGDHQSSGRFRRVDRGVEMEWRIRQF